MGLASLALALRLALVLAAGHTRLGFGDPIFYHAAGMSLSNGDGYEFFGHPTVHWPPGYPFALAAVYRVFGASVTHGLVLNAVVGALTVPLVYVTALRVFGRPSAVVAAAALAVFPGQILVTDLLLSESLYTFGLAAFVALAATLQPRPRSYLALGVVAGLTALTRQEALFFPLVVLLMGWGRGIRLDAVRRAALVAAAMLAVVVPWTVRNAVTVHAFVPVATNAGTTLWSGHNPIANGGPVYATQTNILRRIHRGGSFEVKESALLRQKAISYAVHHPGRELELIPLKLRSLLRGDSHLVDAINSAEQHPLGRRAAVWLRRAADAAFYALLAAMLATIVLLRRTLWRIPVIRGVLAYMALALPLYGFVYYGNYRYRLPLEPLMLLVTAPGAVALWGGWASRGSPR